MKPRNDDPEGTQVASVSNVVPFGKRQPASPTEPFLTDAERAAIRAMLKSYQELGSKVELVLAGCPMARRLLED